jgi:hypothetical protein
VDKAGQVRPKLDTVFMPQFRGQPGEVAVVHPSLQPGQPHAEAGLARRYKALCAGQYQGWWTVSMPYQEFGVSAS